MSMLEYLQRHDSRMFDTVLSANIFPKYLEHKNQTPLEYDTKKQAIFLAVSSRVPNLISFTIIFWPVIALKIKNIMSLVSQ